MSRRRRAGIGAVALRLLPGSSPLHRLWAGTKIISVAVLTLTLSLFPGWPAVVGGVLVVLLAARVGRIPRTVVPRLPWWVPLTLLVGAGLSALGGGLAAFALFLVLGWVLVSLSMIVGWTTPLPELAPAVATVLFPLGKLRLPVAEWVLTIALCVRSLPLLIEELRVVLASRRMRAGAGWQRPRQAAADGVGVVAAVMVASIRRAADMGRAIQARGGSGQLAADARRPGWGDALALALVATVTALTVVAAQMFPSGY